MAGQVAPEKVVRAPPKIAAAGSGASGRVRPGPAAAEGGPVKVVAIKVVVAERVEHGALVGPLLPVGQPAPIQVGPFMAAVRGRMAATARP